MAPFLYHCLAMSVRRQVPCRQCGASHHIRCQVKAGVVYRFLCKGCGAAVLFKHRVRAAPERTRCSETRTRALEPHDSRHDTVVTRGRRIWQGTTLATSDDATIDGVQRIWRNVESPPERGAWLDAGTQTDTLPQSPSAITVSSSAKTVTR